MTPRVLDTIRFDSDIYPFHVEQAHDDDVTTHHVTIKVKRGGTALEIAVETLKHGRAKEVQVRTSLHLSPEDARALALALCPDLRVPS
jgi:hypothetical protein